MSFLAFSHSSSKLQPQLKIVASQKIARSQGFPNSTNQRRLLRYPRHASHAYPVGIVATMQVVFQGESTAAAMNRDACLFVTTPARRATLPRRPKVAMPVRG